MSTRVAAIDCGTNSIRLLIADVEDGGTMTDVIRDMTVVRLGERVDTTGRLSDTALARTFTALDGYVERIRSAGVDESRLRMVATSATRDASNRNDFIAGVRSRLGVDPEVLSGDEEASLSFAGAVSVLDPSTPQPWLITDIGGGSTECVMGSAAGVAAARSVDIGCVRVTERCLADDPPTEAQIADATALIDDALAIAGETVSLSTAATGIGLAGSVTTVAAIALGLPAYDAAVIHGSRIAAIDIHRIATELLSMSRADRSQIPVMHPGRVDVIGAGALILDRLARRAELAEIIVSEHDILDGIALSLL